MGHWMGHIRGTGYTTYGALDNYIWGIGYTTYEELGRPHMGHWIYYI